MWFFTADEHYNHKNIIKYTKRPFSTIDEMNAKIIEAHNKKVQPGDITVHAGDFCFGNKAFAESILKQLNGNHILLRGSHDGWMGGQYHEIWEKTIEEQHIVVCHYPLRVWPKSHYGSWLLHGHCHGCLVPIGKQLDVGVDACMYAPISFDTIKKIMDTREETPRHHPDGKLEDFDVD